jgi:hypothetical protein
MNFRLLSLCFALTLLCSCATRNPTPAEKLPASASFSKSSDRIYLTLHLENGKKLLFGIDTGSSYTILDQSLESFLGKRRGTRIVDYQFFGGWAFLNKYEAPKLYLGDTQLVTGKHVCTDDLRRLREDQPIMGILGIDCLQHYCIQLDFADHKMHFLDPNSLETAKLGEPLPIQYSFFDALPFIRASFPGKSYAYWGIDTGCDTDVALKSKQLRELQEQTSGQFIFTKSMKDSTNGFDYGTFYLTRKIIFNDEVCTNFLWCDGRANNLIGLRYLSRHLTTINFPKRIMYLQHGNSESLADKDSIADFLQNPQAETLYTFIQDATTFLTQQKKNGRLPGWKKDEQGNFSWHQEKDDFTGYPLSETFIATKKSNSFSYHYTILQSSNNAPLKLQNAWQTDVKGHVVEIYHTP